MKPFDPAFVPHLTPAKRPLALGLVAGTAQGLLAVAQAFAVGMLVVRLVSDAAGAWHAPAAWLVVIVLARAATAWVVDTQGAVAAGLVSGALRRRLLQAAADLDPLDLSRERTGALTALATRGTTAVEPYLTKYLPSLVLATVLPVATVATVFWLDWLSGLIIVLTLPLVPLFAILIGQSTSEKADRQWRAMSALSGHFLDVVRGLPTLVANRRAGAQSRTVREVTDRYRRATLETLRVAFASSVALELIATISVALVAVVVGLRLANDGIDFETALIVLLLAPEAYWPLRRVGAEFHAAAEGSATFTAAAEFLARAQQTIAASTAGQRSLDDDRAPSIVLEGVGFTYPDRTSPALAPTTAVLPQRGLVAVAGPSGAGKSTLMALLCGELRASTGRVLLDGTPLDEVDPVRWRSLVATAPQRPWLTAGTIAENLRVARPDATDDELHAALAALDLDEVERATQLGLESPLGEDGAGLSAGQRARLGLARVVLADRPVVLLDEPSAHLDPASEAVLLDTLRRLAATRLVLVVAHRDAVLDAADQVVTVAPAPIAAPTPQDAAASRPATAPPAASGGTRASAPALDPSEGRDLVPPRFGVRTASLLGALSMAAGVSLTATAAWLITRASEHPPVLHLMVAIVAVRAFGLARPVFRYAERLVSHDVAFRELAERRARIYDTLVPLVPGRLGVRRGDVLTSVVDDVDSLVDEQLRVRQPRSTALLVAALAILLASLAHPRAGLVTLLVCVAGLLAHRCTRRGVERAEQQFVAARAEVSTCTEGWFASVRQYVAWGAVPQALEKVDAASRRLARAADRSARASAWGRLVVVVASGAGLVATAWLLEDPLRAGDLSPAMTALLVMLPLALADALLPLVDAASVEVRTRAAHARLEALEAMTPAVPAPPEDAVTTQVTTLAAHPRVAMDGVRAGWGDADALRALDLDLPPGARVGLVGPSGSGKSTVAALLLHFLDPREGAVLLDGVDARQVDPDAVRARVGLVDDDPYVFASTVAENVRLARPGATDDEVRAALHKAHLGSWVEGLPHGLHTFVGEGHAHVSGGERARLALARAVLADQPVLVLDEPTAHLDTATAHEVTAQLLDAGDRTVLWITHGTVGLDRMDHVVSLGADARIAAPA